MVEMLDEYKLDEKIEVIPDWLIINKKLMN